MGPYEVVFKKSVAKDFKAIPKKDATRLLNSIRSLADNPRPIQAIKLTGGEQYRLRRGHYRILYAIEDNRLIVCVVKVGPRKDVYRD